MLSVAIPKAEVIYIKIVHLFLKCGKTLLLSGTRDVCLDKLIIFCARQWKKVDLSACSYSKNMTQAANYIKLALYYLWNNGFLVYV